MHTFKVAVAPNSINQSACLTEI